MSRCGDVYENKVTGEYAVVLRGSEDRGEGPGIVHLTARPGAAVIGEHLHPYMIERFTVVSGRLDARIAGKAQSLGPGQSAIAGPASRMTGGMQAPPKMRMSWSRSIGLPTPSTSTRTGSSCWCRPCSALPTMERWTGRAGQIRFRRQSSLCTSRMWSSLRAPRRRCSARYSPSSRRSQL